MALKTMIEKLQKSRAVYNEDLAKFGEDAQTEFGEILGPLIPPGWALQWTQGTPGFNDGEPCTFSAHEPKLVRAPRDEDDEDADDSDENGGERWDLDSAIKKYGLADKEESYETDDYSKPIYDKPTPLAPRGYGAYGDKRGTLKGYEKKTEKYTTHGFPAIAGWSKAKLKELSAAFDYDDDILERVFGDGSRITITSDGAVTVGEYYCE